MLNPQKKIAAVSQQPLKKKIVAKTTKLHQKDMVSMIRKHHHVMTTVVHHVLFVILL